MILRVRILVKIFLQDSRSVIGLIFDKSFFQSLVLGIGYIDPFLHSVGMLLDINASLNMVVKIVSALIPSFLRARYGICEGPGAEMLLVCLIVSTTSARVIVFVVSSYHS